MKIIFLDFDGVLNHEIFYKKRYDDGLENYPKYPLSEIDPASIAVLNYIIKETGAKVVVSSTWRLGRTASQLQYILEEIGFQGEIIDITPSLSGEDYIRGNEILKWIKKNKNLLGEDYHQYENYVILDDDCDMLYIQKDNFLQVDRWVGLTMPLAARAIRILNRGRGIHVL